MKRKKLIIIYTYITLILLAILLVSYAYISTVTKGNENSKKNTFKSNPLSILYSDNTNLITGDANVSFTPGSTITKTFSLSNSTGSGLFFSISLENVINTFTRNQDITYTLSLNGEVLKSGIFPSSTTTLVYSQFIDSDETLNYTLTINYLNDISENQIVDSGATISAKLVFDYGNGINNIIVYGNSVQNGTPTLDNPIKIESVGDKTNNLLDLYGRTRIASVTNNTTTNTLTPIDYSKYYIGKAATKYYSSNKISSFELNNDTWVAESVNNNYGYGVGFPVEVEPSTKYYIKGIMTNCIVGLSFYDSSNTFISYISNVYSTSSSTNYFTTPANTKTVFIVFLPSGTSAITYTFKNFQLNLTNNSEYESYGYKVPIVIGTNIINIYLKEPLRKIGSYVDYIDLSRKKVVRNVEVVDDTGTLSISESLSGLSTPVEEDITGFDISTIPYDDSITVNTSIQPSNIEINHD